MDKDKYYSKSGVQTVLTLGITVIFLILQFATKGWIQGLFAVWFVWQGIILALQAEKYANEK